MDVRIYTTPQCQWCQKTKEFFQAHDVEYEEIDVTEDQDAVEELVAKSGQKGVPVTVVEDGDDEDVIVGFEEDELRDALDIDE